MKIQNWLFHYSCFKVYWCLSSQKVWTSIKENYKIFEKNLLFGSDYWLSLKNKIKKIYYFLLILAVVFIVPSQCSILKPQLYVIRKLRGSFCRVLFLFASVSQACFEVLYSFSNWRYWSGSSWCHLCPTF